MWVSPMVVEGGSASDKAKAHRCACSLRMSELEERVDQLSQQIAAALQLILDLKGVPR